MNRSRDIKRRKGLAMTAMLFAAMVVPLLLPAYGQEVDPTWYDPWAAPQTVAVHASQPQVARHQHRPALKPVSTAPSAAKLNAKRPATTEAVMTRPAK